MYFVGLFNATCSTLWLSGPPLPWRNMYVVISCAFVLGSNQPASFVRCTLQFQAGSHYYTRNWMFNGCTCYERDNSGSCNDLSSFTTVERRWKIFWKHYQGSGFQKIWWMRWERKKSSFHQLCMLSSPYSSFIWLGSSRDRSKWFSQIVRSTGQSFLGKRWVKLYDVQPSILQIPSRRLGQVQKKCQNTDIWLAGGQAKKCGIRAKSSGQGQNHRCVLYWRSTGYSWWNLESCSSG